MKLHHPGAPPPSHRDLRGAGTHHRGRCWGIRRRRAARGQGALAQMLWVIMGILVGYRLSVYIYINNIIYIYVYIYK